MPSPEVVPEDSELSGGGDSELGLPEVPKKWKALPPTRNGVQSTAWKVEVAETASFRSVVSGMFKQIKDFGDSVCALQNLQEPILEHHYLEISSLTHENSMLRTKIQQLEKQGLGSFRQSEKQHFGGFRKPSQSLMKTGHTSESLVLYASGEDSNSIRASPIRQYSSEGESNCNGGDSTQIMDASNTIHVSEEPRAARTSSEQAPASSSRPKWFITGSKSRSVEMEAAFTHTETGSFGNGFALRDEWVLDDDEFFRIAAKATLEPSASDNDLKFGGSTDLSKAYSVAEWHVPFHPESTTRLCWDALAAILLAYDTIMLPLYLFEFSGTAATRVMDWLTAIFWTVDIPASLSTGTFVKGRLETKFSKVLQTYTMTWMIPDILMVLVEWALLILVGTVDSGLVTSVSAVRNMRILRFVRLVRLVKFDRLVKQLTRRINSVIFLLSLRIIKMVCAIVAINHIIASAWYAIGINGWVVDHIPDQEDILYCYLTSFHWSLTQFHGSMAIGATGLKERFFSVVVLLTALVSVTWFMSSMTNSMIMLQKIHQERTLQTRTLLGFLGQRCVTNTLAVRIKEYVAMHRKENPTIIKERDVTLLDILPSNLLTDLHEELRGHKIRQHPLFHHLSTFFNHFLRQLTQEAVQELHFSAKEIVFSTGQACKHMFFLNSEMYYAPGQLRVPTIDTRELSEKDRFSVLRSSMSNLRRTRSIAIGDGSEVCQPHTWLSEPALWTIWQNCGTLRAPEDSYIYALQVVGFLNAVKNYERARLDATVYARAFVENLNVSHPSDLPSRVDAFKVWMEVQEVRKSQLSQPSIKTVLSQRSQQSRSSRERRSLVSVLSQLIPKSRRSSAQARDGKLPEASSTSYG